MNESPARSYSWRPIEPLPEGAERLASDELRSLEKVWLEQKDTLAGQGGLDRFVERLQREWAIETGILERLYDLDRGVTETLIEKGIRAELIPSDDRLGAERTAAIIGDQQDAVKSAFAFVKRDRPLSVGYINETHALLTRHQDSVDAVDSLGRRVRVELTKGAYKRLPNNPTRPDGRVHEYCPPEHVASEMERLMEFYAEYQARALPPEVLSAWLHHRFTQIHPYQDGNGRVARTLAGLVFIQRNWFPLTIRRDDRERYIESLEAADAGDLGPHAKLFADIQKRTFVQALSIARDVEREHSVARMAQAIRSKVERQRETESDKWRGAKALAGKLFEVAQVRLEAVRRDLESELSGLDFQFRVDSETDAGPRRHYFREQVVGIARRLDYWANLSAFHSWARLTLRDGDQAEILLSFHGIGREFRGLVGISAGFFRREETGEGAREPTPAAPVCEDFFQVNYHDEETALRERFEPWLDLAVLRGLDLWREGL